MESKKNIYELLPPEYYPKTILIRPGELKNEIIQKIRENDFNYPLIAKPDIGGKGKGVKKIASETELLAYLEKFPFNMLVQDFVPYMEEVGIFYYRYPDHPKGNISGIVGKHFLKVEGDGQSTIEQLLKKEKRYILQLSSLRQLLGEDLLVVLPMGEERVLVPYGNHARGAMFADYTHWVDQKLVDSIDAICKKIPDFYFGRLDIRYSSLEKLKEGKEFSLIEVNGAGSEPTHMYDPVNSLIDAWKQIIKHWLILWRISRQNHAKGIAYLSGREGIRMFRQAREYDKVLDTLV